MNSNMRDVNSKIYWSGIKLQIGIPKMLTNQYIKLNFQEQAMAKEISDVDSMTSGINSNRFIDSSIDNFFI